MKIISKWDGILQARFRRFFCCYMTRTLSWEYDREITASSSMLCYAVIFKGHMLLYDAKKFSAIFHGWRGRIKWDNILQTQRKWKTLTKVSVIVRSRNFVALRARRRDSIPRHFTCLSPQRLLYCEFYFKNSYFSIAISHNALKDAMPPNSNWAHSETYQLQVDAEIL